MSADLSLVAEAGCHLGSGCGFPAPGAGIFEFEPYWTWSLFGLTVHVTKPMLLCLVSVVIVCGFFLYAFRSPKLVPRGAQNLGEVGYHFIRDGISRDVIGKDGDRYVPMLFSLFFLIWIYNLLGVIPTAQFPVTSRFAIPVGLAAIVYVTWVSKGIRVQGLGGFLKNIAFPPGVPKALYVILTPIELFSNLVVRPFTHAVRLFANMFAGHLLITTFAVATWYLLSGSFIGIAGSTASFVLTIVLTAFEMLIQGLQAYIFTLLTAVYLAGAIHPEH